MSVETDKLVRSLPFVLDQVQEEINQLIDSWISNDPFAGPSEFVNMIVEKLGREMNAPHTALELSYKSFVKAAAVAIVGAVKLRQTINVGQ